MFVCAFLLRAPPPPPPDLRWRWACRLSCICLSQICCACLTRLLSWCVRVRMCACVCALPFIVVSPFTVFPHGDSVLAPVFACHTPLFFFLLRASASSSTLLCFSFFFCVLGFSCGAARACVCGFVGVGARVCASLPFPSPPRSSTSQFPTSPTDLPVKIPPLLRRTRVWGCATRLSYSALRWTHRRIGHHATMPPAHRRGSSQEYTDISRSCVLEGRRSTHPNTYPLLHWRYVAAPPCLCVRVCGTHLRETHNVRTADRLLRKKREMR